MEKKRNGFRLEQQRKGRAPGGIVTAVCTVLMFLTGLIPVGTYALPAIAGVVLVLIVIEIGVRWAWAVYAAVSLLSILLAADKEAAVLFALFFGYYPILKSNIERVRGRLFQWMIKLAVFNALWSPVFSSQSGPEHPGGSFTLFGIYLPWVFLLAGNAVFVLYDYALTGLISTYVFRFRHVVRKTLHLK